MSDAEIVAALGSTVAMYSSIEAALICQVGDDVRNKFMSSDITPESMIFFLNI